MSEEQENELKYTDFIIGIPVGLVAFYGLSVASAFWIGISNPDDYLWSLLIGALVCCLLGFVVAWRASSAVVAFGLMVVLGVIGFVAGSNAYLWVPPFPADLLPLLFHGARSPVVIGPIFLIGTAGIVRSIATARERRAVAMPSPADDAVERG